MLYVCTEKILKETKSSAQTMSLHQVVSRWANSSGMNCNKLLTMNLLESHENLLSISLNRL